MKQFSTFFFGRPGFFLFGGILTFLCLHFWGTFKSPMTSQPISFKDAKAMHDLYCSTRKKAIEDEVGNIDPSSSKQVKYAETEAIWYSADSIRKMLCTVEKEVNCSPDSVGLRIYLGAYSDTDADPSTNPYKHRMSVFLVGTRKEYSSSARERVDSDYVDKNNNKIFALFPRPYTDPTTNHGDLCPTNCNGSAFK